MIKQISVPGWDSFKIGTFEEKLHHFDRDIGNKNSDESEPSNDLSFKKTLEEFPNIYKTSHEEGGRRDGGEGGGGVWLIPRSPHLGYV